jgi:hypothetical protein
VFLISNIRLILNVVFLLLGDYPASEFYMPTFRYTLFHLHRSCKFYTTHEDRTDNISKRRHIKFRRQRIAQKKE